MSAVHLATNKPSWRLGRDCPGEGQSRRKPPLNSLTGGTRG